MFCQNCGKADQKANAYCRQCGEWLVDQKSARKHGTKPEDKMKVMIVFNGVDAVFVLISTVALYATYLGTHEAKWSIYLAGCFCSIIAIHQLVSLSFAVGLRQKFKRGRSGSQRSIQPKPEDLPLLERSGTALESAETAPIIDTPSVTENTTELFESSRRQEAHRSLKEG